MERQIKKLQFGYNVPEPLEKTEKLRYYISNGFRSVCIKQEDIKMAQTGKITALYCRFSADDGMKGDSDSIAHQKNILTEYANNHGLTNQRFYVDDGVSGVTFERAGFKAMLTDIENGLVGTVVVKDMSRFGRNYLMVGQYLEIVFPEYGVRFIAISDNVDSNEGINDLMPINNLLNEWYARDISRKQRELYWQTDFFSQHKAYAPYR